MSYIVIKKVKGHEYKYEVESYRIEGKVKQRILHYLGRVDVDAVDIEKERVTLRVPKQQLEMLDALVKMRDFPSVSEAIREAVKEMLEKRCGEFDHKVMR